MSFNNTKTPLKPTTKAKWQIPMRPHPKAGCLEYCLEGELRERFVKLFPIHSNARLMKWFGIGFSTVQRFKRELGLAKDMKAIRRQQARDAKRTNERNGYYDSLRGKPPSEAAIEGARRKRSEGFNPMLECKQKNPCKYRKCVKKRAKAWAETLRKEKVRVLYGLPQRTKFRICLSPLSRQAIAHKYSMIHYCNYFADPEHSSWVCYDADTNRSLRREATALRHGLRIIDAGSCNDSNDKQHVTGIHSEARPYF